MRPGRPRGGRGAADTGDGAVKKEFIVEREGRSFVLYAGLLDLAHERGLKGITTTLVQVPSELNGMSAIVHATVETETGTFTGLGVNHLPPLDVALALEDPGDLHLEPRRRHLHARLARERGVANPREHVRNRVSHVSF